MSGDLTGLVLKWFIPHLLENNGLCEEGDCDW